MAVGKIYIARTVENRIKATIDVDCLPSDATHVESFTTTADLDTQAGRSERFFHLLERLRLMELIGFEICIDFGSHFYETGGELKLPHSVRVKPMEQLDA